MRAKKKRKANNIKIIRTTQKSKTITKSCKRDIKIKHANQSKPTRERKQRIGSINHTQYI